MQDAVYGGKKQQWRNTRQGSACVSHEMRIRIPYTRLTFRLFCFCNYAQILIVPHKVGGNPLTTYGGYLGFYCKVESLFLKPSEQLAWLCAVLQIMSKLCVLLTYHLPSCSPKCRPLSVEMTLSSSMSHLFPTRITWALSQEYVLIWVDLKEKHKAKNDQRRTQHKMKEEYVPQTMVIAKNEAQMPDI